MAHGTAAEVAQKWSRNAQAGQQDYTAGVNRVTQSPTAAAAAAGATWQARVSSQAALQKFQRKLNAVSLDEWKTRTTSVGAQRFAQGVAASESKMQSAMTSLLPFIDNLKAQVKSMPNATLQDRIQRMNAWVMGMSQYTGT